jgi:phospholipase D1/2
MECAAELGYGPETFSCRPRILQTLGLPILRTNDTVWKVATAQRMSVFPDVATCFEAVRSSLLQAQKSITIIGWDIDSRTPLAGCTGKPADDLPCHLGPFLKELVGRKPKLRIRLLLWDFSTLYALEREAFPKSKLAWDNVDLVLDNTLPTGSSQHQKLVIVDDAVAFSGGLDLTIRRWDTAAHPFDLRQRCDPRGKPYDPFHDVQAIVDGQAAFALAELANERWRLASGESIPVTALGHPWPEGIAADLENVDVGISRTVPSNGEDAGIAEVERLFERMIERAERSIYIENQYLTSEPIANRLAEQLRQKPGLEILIIAPKSHDLWLEALAMRNGRIRFARILKEAGGDRVRIAYPVVESKGVQKAVMVHSKVMIVDDQVLRVGSANLNNRSMGTDTECDLTVVAASQAMSGQIRDIRDRLAAVHCGVAPNDMAACIGREGLIRASMTMRGEAHALHDIDDGELLPDNVAGVAEVIGDPERPIDAAAFLAEISGEDAKDIGRRAGWILAGAGLAMAVLAVGWAYYSDNTNVFVARILSIADGSLASLVLITLAFVAASLLMVPIMLLIGGTTAALGLAAGIPVAAAGTLISAVCGYFFGWSGGRRLVQQVSGGRLLRLRQVIVDKGILAIATIRLLPIAPFTMVNMAAGALRVGFVPFLAGSIIGLAPGFVVLALLGQQLYGLVSEPSLPGLMLVLALVACWMGVAFLAKYFIAERKLGHG